jgi:hypothetical protein
MRRGGKPHWPEAGDTARKTADGSAVGPPSEGFEDLLAPPATTLEPPAGSPPFETPLETGYKLEAGVAGCSSVVLGGSPSCAAAAPPVGRAPLSEWSASTICMESLFIGGGGRGW